ncbi:MAG: hypothetical protein ACFB15_32035 [Cyclobacteriaceae bacterium]
MKKSFINKPEVIILRYLVSLLLLFLCINGHGQGSRVFLDPDYYHLLSRYEILQGQQASEFDSNVKTYQRTKVRTFLDSLSLNRTVVDKFNLQYLLNDNWPFVDSLQKETNTAFLRYFYRRPSDFWHVQTKGLLLRVNPVLYFGVGADDREGIPYVNTRGVQIDGVIDKKVGLYAFISENQMALPGYSWDYTQQTLTVPYQGFWKGYGSRGIDFLNTRAHLNFSATQHIQLELGYGKHFIGNGFRSLVLSDFSNNYAYFRGDVDVWRIHFTYLLGQLTADIFGNETGLFGTTPFPIKQMAMHRVGIDVTKKLNIGLFEAIVYGDESERFDARYLNPFAFYRVIEQQNGSNGNALLGVDADWIIGKHWNAYAQFVLDELIVSELRNNQGWWGNKYALQVGGKYIDAFSIRNLDLQIEHNRVRPYTYAHEDLYRAYTHYRQPLAHPLGANLSETVFLAQYQPFGRLTLRGRGILARFGADTLNSNWGSDILLDNRTREQEYGNELGQGIATDLTSLEAVASYQVWHNVFVDVSYLHRLQTAAELDLEQKTNFLSLSLRVNIERIRHDY